jgi:hypothetical protein
VNAFVFGPGGGARQWIAAGFAGISAAGIVAAWGLLLSSWVLAR